jgi:hypothetical protein
MSPEIAIRFLPISRTPVRSPRPETSDFLASGPAAGQATALRVRRLNDQALAAGRSGGLLPSGHMKTNRPPIDLVNRSGFASCGTRPVLASVNDIQDHLSTWAKISLKSGLS